MSTYASLHFHVTFSTKYRKPLIDSAWEDRLHDYLGGVIKRLEGFPQGIGGFEDHIHLLIGLKPTHRLSDVMRELKKSSSTWVHETIGRSTFQWQEGYAVFSVGATSRTAVRNYIANQREHHRVRSFREELVELLARAEVDYDPKYLD